MDYCIYIRDSSEVLPQLERIKGLKKQEDKTLACKAIYDIVDERRMRVVEMGGAKELLNVLKSDTDDKTRKEILNALVALSKSGSSLCILVVEQ